MKISIIEKLHSNSDQFRKQREKMFITKFNTKYKGMNRKSQLIATFFKKYFGKYFQFGTEDSIVNQVLIIISQSDVEFVKNSKYITEEF